MAVITNSYTGVAPRFNIIKGTWAQTGIRYDVHAAKYNRDSLEGTPWEKPIKGFKLLERTVINHNNNLSWNETLKFEGLQKKSGSDGVYQVSEILQNAVMQRLISLSVRTIEGNVFVDTTKEI